MNAFRTNLGLVVATVLSLGAASFAAPDFFIKLNGVKQGLLKGESLAAKRTGWTEGLAFGYDVSSPTDPATGQATGRAQYGLVSFVKAWGAASPQLFQAATTNEILKEVIFEFTTTTLEGTDQVFYRVTLSNARVTRFRQFRTLLDPDELDSVSLAYQTIQVESVLGNTTATGSPISVAARGFEGALGLSYSFVDGRFQVALPEGRPVRLRFLDLQGAVVKEIAAEGGSFRFDAVGLGIQPGMYLLQGVVDGRGFGAVPVSIPR